MTRCTNCILPEEAPGISFDDNGVCNYCRSYVPFQPKGEAALRELIASIQKPENKYDCIVPLSGGRDSSFVLWMARVALGLKVMAVSYDNEFNTAQAEVNVRRACQRIAVDLERVRSRRNLAQKVVANNVRSSLSFGCAGAMAHLCRACSYGYHAVVYRAAERYRVPLILWGTSADEGRHPLTEVAFRGVKYGGWGRLRSPSFFRAEWDSLRLRLEFPVPGNPIWHRYSPVNRNPAIREISLFDYVPWDRRRIKDTITTELGWEKPPNHASSWRIDCELHPYINYCYYKLVGCSKACLGYCSMINSGQMSREEALEQEEGFIASHKEEMEKVVALLEKRTGLRRREFVRAKVLE